jgi:hypothetical protein
MNRSIPVCVVFIALAAILAYSQVAGSGKAVASPPEQASVTVAGKTISLKYSAPSVRGRQIFGEGGVVSKDPTYPVWRAGANAATALNTDADLTIKGLAVPKGDYTIYMLVKGAAWHLIINKQTGQSGTVYQQAQDLGRVPMDMGKPPSRVEKLKYTLSAAGASAGKLQLEWDNFVASVPFTVK